MLIKCICGCGVLSIDKIDNEYSITYYKGKFYTDHIWQNITDRLKHTFYTLIGKEYYLYEVIITEEQFQELIKGADNLERDQEK